MPQPDSITVLLESWRNGNTDARAQVFDRLYTRLRDIASSLLRQQGPGHTLEPAALVNEAFLRFLGEGQVTWNDRTHFLSTAAQVMRRYWIDHIRRDAAQKRGGGSANRIQLDDNLHLNLTTNPTDILALHQALDSLAHTDPRAASVVEMKFFAGLTEEEIATVHSISAVSVRRDWAFARAYLIDRMKI